VIRILSRCWPFSHKFAIVPSGETNDRIKKKFKLGGGGVQRRDGPSITMPSMVEIVGGESAVNEKCDVFCL